MIHPARNVFIVNPVAGKGAVRRQWPRIKALVDRRKMSAHIMYTEKKGDAVQMSRIAVMQGASRIICVGGDGTFNEVVNGLMRLDAGRRKNLMVGFVPLGTGCDFARSALLPVAPKQVIETIFFGKSKTIDIGKLSFVDDTGKTCSRFFHNVVSFGLGGDVDRLVEKMHGIPGTIAFLIASLRSLAARGTRQVCIRIDSNASEKRRVLNVAVANGAFHGGGMQVAPEAKIDDGIFHISVIGDMRIAEVFWNLPRLYTGRLGKVRKVIIRTGKRIEAWSDERVSLDVDGESPGNLPVVIEIVPRCLRLMVARPLE